MKDRGKEIWKSIMSRRTKELAAARKAEAIEENQRKARMRFLRNGFLGAIAVVALGFVGYASHQYMSKPLDAEAVAAWDVDKVYPSDITFGDPTAPVRVTEYGSLTCIHCRNFHENHLTSFLRDYVDSGKAYFVFRHFPYDQAGLAGASLVSCLNDEAQASAVSSMMSRQSSWVHSAQAAEAAADVLGLEGDDRRKALDCAVQETTTSSISEIGLEASRHGVSSTPTFVVGGSVYSGFMGAKALGALVDRKMAEEHL